MKFYQKVAAYAVILGALVGCGKKETPHSLEDQKVVGIPLSAEVAGRGDAQHGNSLSIVIQPKGEGLHGKPPQILCSSGHMSRLSKLVEITALVKAEMNDGDEQTIELSGRYEMDIFRFDHVRVESRHAYTKP